MAHLVGIPIVVLGAALAIAVLRLGPSVPHARALAVLLLAEVLVLGSSSAGFAALLTSDAARTTALRLHQALDAILIPAYLPFLARSLPSRLLVPFRAAAPVAALWLVAGALAAASIAWEGAWAWTVAFMLAGFGYALAASALAARQALTALGARRARLLLVAFGLRDLGWGAIYGCLVFAPAVLQWVELDALLVAYALVAGVYVVLLAYGILAAHLFDIDLRVKWTISRGTLAAAAGALYFFLTEVATQFLSNRLGLVLGVLAAALLVFFLPRLHALFDRLADRVAPQHQPTPEYLAFRKMQVYAAALEEALSDGVVSVEERRMLEGLRRSLAVGPEDAAAMEADLSKARGGPAAR